MKLRRDLFSLAGYFAALAGLGLTAASVGPTLPALASVAGVGLAQIGFLLFARSLGEVFGCLFAGSAIDRGHGRAVLGLSVLILAGCLAMIPFFKSLLLFAGVFLVLGAAQGAVHTGANTLLVWKHPDRAQSLLSVLHLSFGAGMVVAPLLVAWFLPLRADGLFIYWFLSIALVPVILLLVASEKTISPRRVHQTVQIRSSSRVALFWAIALFFFYVGAEINMGAWLYTYALQAAQFTPATAAYLVATFWGAFMVGRLLSVFGSAVVNPMQYVSGGLLVGVLSTAGVVASSQSEPYLWICVAILGLSMAAIFPQAFSYISDLLGMSGRRTASLLIAGSFGGMLLPWLTGQLLESVSPHALPIIVGVAMALAFGAFLMVGRTVNYRREFTVSQ